MDLQAEIDAPRVDARRPARALQRPGLPLQHADRDVADGPLAWLFGWKPRPFFATEPGTATPTVELGAAG
jgi:hypothetical protein